MTDASQSRTYRTGYTVEWAFALRDAVMGHVRDAVPELEPRWSLKGISFEAYVQETSLVLVLRSNEERVTTAGPATPRPLPEGCPELPATADAFRGWEAEFRAWHGLGNADLVAVLPVLCGADKPTFPRPEGQWEKFSSTQQALWSAAVRAGFFQGLQHLLSHPPSLSATASVAAPPIAGEVYREHPEFEPPADLDQPIWRYMSVPKFLSLLEGRAVYFARADLLGDEWEGALGEANARIDRREGVPWLGSPRKLGEVSAVFVSCWHAQDGESAAMWSLYAGWDPISREGVAVRTTFRKMLESLAGADPVSAGQVIYHDYKHEFVPEDNFFAAYLRKRRSFEHEREIRAIVARDVGPYPDGIAVPAQLDAMVVEVRVAPSAPSWMRDLIESVTRRYGLSCPVLQSAMDAPPLRLAILDLAALSGAVVATDTEATRPDELREDALAGEPVRVALDDVQTSCGRASSDPNQASFAFNLAKRDARAAGIDLNLTRAKLAADADFPARFTAAQLSVVDGGAVHDDRGLDRRMMFEMYSSPSLALALQLVRASQAAAGIAPDSRAYG